IVLTAAHCLEASAQVTADIGRVTWAEAAARGRRRPGTAFAWGPGEGRGDWAVVRLTRRYTPEAYPRLAGDGSVDGAGRMFRAVGWGLTSVEGAESPVLRQVDLPAVPDRQCGARAAAEICAGDWAAGGVDTCAGDSGGPLLYADGGRWVQVGITSWGHGCAAPHHPGHYTRVSAFVPRIRAAITRLGGAPPAG
ncbi:MAG TPA: serine protease, partial [Pilimelia sp.]|nr:serine protease [Pilimelia sp.]